VHDAYAKPESVLKTPVLGSGTLLRENVNQGIPITILPNCPPRSIRSNA
jgi:hypothetical protein